MISNQKVQLPLQGKDYQYERMVKHIGFATTIELQNLHEQSRKENFIPEPLLIIKNQLEETHLLTADHFFFLVAAPQIIQLFSETVIGIEFQLEDENRMISLVLQKMGEDKNKNNFLLLFKILIEKLQNADIKKMALDTCISKLNDNVFAEAFIYFVEYYPTQDFWDYVINMNFKFCNAACALLYNQIQPKNRGQVIKKAIESKDPELFPLLKMINLTKEEIKNYNIENFAINLIKSSLEENDKTTYSIIHDSFVFMVDLIKILQAIPSDFINIAYKLINEGCISEKGEALKFFSEIFPLMNSDSINRVLTQTDIVNASIDIINSDSSSSVITAALKLTYFIIQLFPDIILPKIDECTISIIFERSQTNDPTSEIASALYSLLHQLYLASNTF